MLHFAQIGLQVGRVVSKLRIYLLLGEALALEFLR